MGLKFTKIDSIEKFKLKEFFESTYTQMFVDGELNNFLTIKEDKFDSVRDVIEFANRKLDKDMEDEMNGLVNSYFIEDDNFIAAMGKCKYNKKLSDYEVYLDNIDNEKLMARFAILVKKKYRNKGIASAIFHELLRNELRSEYVGCFVSEVMNGNTKSINFHKKMSSQLDPAYKYEVVKKDDRQFWVFYKE